MTTPEEPAPSVTLDDTVHYIKLLETVVAGLAVNAGINPETLMSNALQQITVDSGMETEGTQRLIEERWANRNVTAGSLVAKVVKVTQPETPLEATQTAEPVDMASRLADYKQRRADNGTPTS